MGAGYDVHITDTQTGETRVWHENADWDGLCEFDWFDNNRSCDCNRGTFFEYAAGHSWQSAPSYECGDSRFRVRCFDAGGNLLAEDEITP